jgi:hypothetical protein
MVAALIMDAAIRPRPVFVKIFAGHSGFDAKASPRFDAKASPRNDGC